MKACAHQELKVAAVTIDEKRKKAHFLMECYLCEKRCVFEEDLPQPVADFERAGKGDGKP